METCPNHPNRKIKQAGVCGSCYDKALKLANPSYRKRQILNTKYWYATHPEYRALASKRRREQEIAARKKDPVGFYIIKRNRTLKKAYGITHADYLGILEKQLGGCAICGRHPAPSKVLHVDHNHKTGKVRGLLCHQCNWYMGTIDADPKILERIYAYRKRT